MNIKKRIGIYGMNPFSGNRGVGALAYSLLFILEKIANDQEWDLDITLINSDRDKSVIKIKENEIGFKNIDSLNLNLRSIVRACFFPKEWKKLMVYSSFDYVMNLGEGDSFSDIYGFKRFCKINNQHRISRLFNKRYALLPQTIGPFKDASVKNKAEESIEKAQLVLARDETSFNYVVQNTKQKNIFESMDLAFYMPFEKQEFSNEFIHVGFNISALLWNGGYTRNNQFDLNCNYQKLVQDLIRYFLSIPNVKLHIIPHVVMPNSNIENDYELSLCLVDKFKNERLILAPFFLTPIVAKNYISGLDFFIGSRMHSTIAAFSSGVPVYPLAYSRKFNGLFIKSLNYEYLGDMVNQEGAHIMEEIKNAYSNRKQLKEIIDNRLVSIVKQRGLLIENQIKTFLK